MSIILVEREQKVMITKRHPGLPNGWTAPRNDPGGVSKNMWRNF